MSKNCFQAPCLISAFCWFHFFVFHSQELLISQDMAYSLLLWVTASAQTHTQFSAVPVRLVKIPRCLSTIHHEWVFPNGGQWPRKKYGSTRAPHKETVKRTHPFILEMNGQKGIGAMSSWSSSWRWSHRVRLVFSGQFELAYSILQGYFPECHLELFHSTWPSTFTRLSLSSNPRPWSFQSDISRMPHPCLMPPQVSLSHGCIAVLHIYVNQVQSSGKPGTAWLCQTATSLTRFASHHSSLHLMH